MNSAQPDISVITVNYNGYHDTCEFIDSWVNTVTSVPYEIIVVDNGSTANEGLLLQQKYPSVHVIRSEQNLGFAGGNNLGIKSAKGNYLFLLNNDTLIVKDTVYLLIKMQKHHEPHTRPVHRAERLQRVDMADEVTERHGRYGR